MREQLRARFYLAQICTLRGVVRRSGLKLFFLCLLTVSIFLSRADVLERMVFICNGQAETITIELHIAHFISHREVILVNVRDCVALSFIR